MECGLKAVLLKERKLTKTSELDPSDLKEAGHDLMYWAKELRLPATLLGVPTQFRIRDGKERHEAKRAHEAWRFGVAIHIDDDEKLEAWLKSLWDWAGGNI